MRRLIEVTGTEFLLEEQEAVSLLDRFTSTRVGREVARDGDGRD